MDVALSAAEAFEQEVDVQTGLNARQARNRRYYEKRLKASENKTIKTFSDDQDVSDGNTLAPSLSPPDPPKPTPTPENITTHTRGSRLPEGWEPDADGWSYAIEHLGSPQLAHAEADKFRDYWRAVPGAKGRKSDWPATWRNWTRRASENLPRKANAQRPHPDNRQAAREANHAAAFRGADIAARQRWEP